MDEARDEPNRLELYHTMLAITREMLASSREGDMEEASAAIARRQQIIEALKGMSEPVGEHLSQNERDEVVAVLWEIAEMDQMVRSNLAQNLREETAKAEEARKQVRMLKNIRDCASSATPRFYDQKG